MTPEMHEEDRIARALERAPAVAVPAGFAARLMERLPERKVRAIPEAAWLARRTHYGRNAMLAAAGLLCCLLIVVAMASNGGAAWRLAEWTAMAQLVGIALWCGLGWRARSSI